MTKVKLWQNSNCDTTQIVRKRKKPKYSIVTQLENSNDDKTWELKLWQNSKTQILKKPEIWQISIYEENTLNGSFSKIIFTHWQQMRCSLGSVLRFSQCFYLFYGFMSGIFYTASNSSLISSFGKNLPIT